LISLRSRNCSGLVDDVAEGAVDLAAVVVDVVQI